MNEELQAQVLDLGRRWAAAELSGDVAALSALLADDFVLVGPLGFVLDKEQYLGSRRSGDLRHDSLEWEDVRSASTATPRSRSDLRHRRAPTRAAAPPVSFG